MSGKFALIIANTEYIDRGLAQLTAPGKDAEHFARVLKDQNICAFDDVKVLLNQPEHIVRRAIEVFFDTRKPSDLILFYFSGHGIRDELGALYLAVKNTVRTRLRSTAIKSDYIREVMDHSRSKRQVLILDCCNSGAFAQGMKAATGVSIGTASAFQGTGYGRIVLTASDSTQFAWEGDKIIGEIENSLFTHYLVKGLEGEADQDGDGTITIDELYDYAYEQIVSRTPKQTPGKWSFKQQGEIILRRSADIRDIKPIPLPIELIDEIEDTRPYVREAAVQKLEKILRGKNIRLTQSAIEALEKIAADENTTRRVAQAATRALEAFLQATPNTEKIRKEEIDSEIEGIRAAEHGTQEYRVEPQRIESARRTRESEQLRYGLPVVPTAQTTEKKASERQVQRVSTPKLLPATVGVALFFLLCLGGGWAAWRSVFSPMPTESSEAPPAKTMFPGVSLASTITPSQTATATATEVTPTFTPTATITVTPFAPQEPDQFVTYYFEIIIYTRDYERAWSLLSDTFKFNNDIKVFEDWKKDWEPVVEWKRPNFTIQYITPTQVIVSTPEILFRTHKWYPLTNLKYCLIRDESRNTWIITAKAVCGL